METNFWDAVALLGSVGMVCGMFCYFAYLASEATGNGPQEKDDK